LAARVTTPGPSPRPPARSPACWRARATRGGHPPLRRRLHDSRFHARDFERASDRAHLGELYLKLKGSETGLGDLVLEAYDRTAALVAGRQSELRQLDPNAHLSDPMQFTLTGLEGGKLALSSLRGKVVVLDFWATCAALAATSTRSTRR